MLFLCNIRYAENAALVKHVVGKKFELWNKKLRVLLLLVAWKIFHQKPIVVSINWIIFILLNAVKIEQILEPLGEMIVDQCK